MARRGEDLYEKHARSVYRYLFSLSGEPDTAEDLTQETFCQALKSLDTFRGDCTPQVWLCAIAKRLWYKELEHRSRTAPLEEEHPPITRKGRPSGGRTVWPSTEACGSWTRRPGRSSTCVWRESSLSGRLGN